VRGQLLFRARARTRWHRRLGILRDVASMHTQAPAVKAPQTPLPVHPFPARMAPELALNRLPDEPARVLDPMMGSGTIPVLAGSQGHFATGYDLDPLALLISEVWGRPLNAERYIVTAEAVSEQASEMTQAEIPTDDEETQEFVKRWFDEVARERLAALAHAIEKQEQAFRPALWCAFSRRIITKDTGASLARDVSHSRPHKVKDRTDFNPIKNYLRSAKEVARRHATLSEERPRPEDLVFGRVDARALPLKDDSIDMVMTSPPYLIAIDYLRGHRMSLVWMGYTVGELRDLRAGVVGAERARNDGEDHEQLIEDTLGMDAPRRTRGVLRRYLYDLHAIMKETARVLRSGGSAVFVVADATLFGIPVALGDVVDTLAREVGLEQRERMERELPADRRYLPPPGREGKSDLNGRMRHEVCLGYVAS
jgi:tRNA G10  N-methylase Trm11